MPICIGVVGIVPLIKCIVLIRSFHFQAGKTSCFSSDYSFYSFFPPLFEIILRKQFTTYHFETSYMISVSLNLFGTHSLRPNNFPIRSYLPEHRKPCYRLNSETVTGTGNLFSGKCSVYLTDDPNNFGRRNWSNPCRSNMPPIDFCFRRKFFLGNRKS